MPRRLPKSLCDNAKPLPHIAKKQREKKCNLEEQGEKHMVVQMPVEVNVVVRSMQISSYQDLNAAEGEIGRLLHCTTDRRPVCLMAEPYQRFRHEMLGNLMEDADEADQTKDHATMATDCTEISEADKNKDHAAMHISCTEISEADEEKEHATMATDCTEIRSIRSNSAGEDQLLHLEQGLCIRAKKQLVPPFFVIMQLVWKEACIPSAKSESNLLPSGCNLLLADQTESSLFH